MIRKYGLYSLLISTIFLQAEPSVYGFSNQQGTADSYQNEGTKTKKEIIKLKQRIAKQDEQIAGITSLLEGMGETIRQIKEEKSKNTTQGAEGNTRLIQELGAMIDKISSTYVSKEELKGLLGKKIPSTVKKKLKKEDTLAKKSLSSLYSEGARLFLKKRYDEANKRFIITDTKGYKPAASNYYLGEIAYYSKKYKDAIFYFKKSAGLYENASYIDVLLLHTAIALEHTGEKEQAKIFYNNIIENYKGKKSASIAQKRVQRL